MLRANHKMWILIITVCIIVQAVFVNVHPDFRNSEDARFVYLQEKQLETEKQN